MEQVVGTVTIFINREFLERESLELLVSILYAKVIRGLITAVIAVLLAAWLSRRITAPVIVPTQATQAIVQSGDTQFFAHDLLGGVEANVRVV